MDSSRLSNPLRAFAGIVITLSLSAAVSPFAQAQTQQPAPEAQVTTQAADAQPTPPPSPAAAEAEATQKRLNRARALAGQTVNAVRTHLERYRSFGVNVADASELPPDAAGDVDQLRALLEHVVEQARALHAEQLKGGTDGSRGLDAAALLEDAATVRMRIARHDEDRARWQAEVSEARQHLFSSETRIASISEIPAARPAPPPAVAASKSPTPAATPTPNSKKAAQPAAPPPANAATTNTAPANATRPAAPVAGNSPVAVGSLMTKARSRVAPSYPALARTARVSGNVTVFLILNEKGEVENVMRAEGPPQLQQAAIDAARRWKFNPTVISGQPVRVSGYLTFNFTL